MGSRTGAQPAGSRSRTWAAAETSSARGRATSTSARRAFLQEQFGGLHDRLGVEAV